jgi:hypothetical protein
MDTKTSNETDKSKISSASSQESNNSNINKPPTVKITMGKAAPEKPKRVTGRANKGGKRKTLRNKKSRRNKKSKKSRR